MAEAVGGILVATPRSPPGHRRGQQMTAPAVVTASREIAAPPGRVFDAWLDPKEAAQFLFATPGGKIVRCDIDARVGGRFLFTVRRADGGAKLLPYTPVIARKTRL